jgi:hypothetical protein
VPPELRSGGLDRRTVPDRLAVQRSAPDGHPSAGGAARAVLGLLERIGGVSAAFVMVAEGGMLRPVLLSEVAARLLEPDQCWCLPDPLWTVTCAAGLGPTVERWAQR